MNIELGGGTQPISRTYPDRFPNYINFDIIDSADRKWDLRKGIPLEDESVDNIASFEFIEHLYKEEGQYILRECYRVLKPGGGLVISCPDLTGLATLWTRIEDLPDRQYKLRNYLYTAFYGLGDEWNAHRSGWTTSEMMAELYALGFKMVLDRRDEFFQWLLEDPNFPGGRPLDAKEMTSIKIYVRAQK